MKCPFCGHSNLRGTAECEQCQSSLVSVEVDTVESRMERCLVEEKVESLKPRIPITVGQNESLAAAARIMKDEDVGCLLVVDGIGQLKGILTEGRLLRRLGGEVSKLNELTVSDVMKPNPESISPNQPLAHAIHLMIVGGIRYLPLVDRQQRPVGIVSSGDIVEFIETHCPAT